jgi:S-adenosylmethionine hydrolase
VIHVDSFGNLITSLPAELLAAGGGGAEVAIEVEGTEGRFRPVFGRTFSDVQPGALIGYIGSGGHLEIARRDGSAAARVGASRGTAVRVTVAAS